MKLTHALSCFALSSVPLAGCSEFNLSEREMQILNGLVNGLTYKMLAEELFISIDTVRSHIKKLYEKMHVHSRNEAVAVAVNHGVRPEPK